MTTQLSYEESESQIIISTLCRDCVFATWNKDLSKQTGCRLGRLDKYKEKNKANLRAEDNLEYYIIDTICNTCRTKEWSDMFKNPEQKIMEQVAVKTDIILIYNEENFHDNILFLSNMEYKPSNVFVVVDYSQNISIKQIAEELGKTSLVFEVVKFFSYEKLENIIDNIVSTKINGTYYMVINGSGQIPTNVFENINNRINYSLSPFSIVLTPYKNYHGLIVHSKTHKVINGFKAQNLIEKIKILAENQNAQHMIVELDQI